MGVFGWEFRDGFLKLVKYKVKYKLDSIIISWQKIGNCYIYKENSQPFLAIHISQLTESSSCQPYSRLMQDSIFLE